MLSDNVFENLIESGGLVLSFFANYYIFVVLLSIGVVLFACSFAYMKWNSLKGIVRGHMIPKGGYDYKEIFQKYFSHINSIQDKRSLYRAILQVICEVSGSADATLLLKDNNEYILKESFGSKPVTFHVGDIHHFLKWLKEYAHSLTRHQLVNRKEFAKVKGEGLQYCIQFHSEGIVPLFMGGDLLGVINIGVRENGQLFDAALLELLDTLGGQASVAIHNASMYEDIVRRNVQLQEVGRLKSQLLSNVSHEFRTPLSSIIGLAEVVKDGGDGPINPEQKEHLDMVVSSGKRLLETVSAMVDLAKLEANHLSLNVRRLNLNKMVSKIATEMVPKEKVSLKMSIDQETPPIYGDEDWLKKLFSHILSNAVKYTGNGEIVVDAEKSGEMIKIGVHDTGIGIEPEMQHKIFESFSQATEGVDRNYEGSGVGLAISKKVVELHGGRIWLNSQPGKGSHFFFTLPLKPTRVKTVELV